MYRTDQAKTTENEVETKEYARALNRYLLRSTGRRKPPERLQEFLSILQHSPTTTVPSESDVNFVGQVAKLSLN